MNGNNNGAILCAYCKWNVTNIDITKLNSKCPRCRSGLFTKDNIPYGIEAQTAPRFRDAFTPPDLQRGNVLMPNDPNIPK